MHGHHSHGHHVAPESDDDGGGDAEDDDATSSWLEHAGCEEHAEDPRARVLELLGIVANSTYLWLGCAVQYAYPEIVAAYPTRMWDYESVFMMLRTPLCWLNDSYVQKHLKTQHFLHPRRCHHSHGATHHHQHHVENDDERDDDEGDDHNSQDEHDDDEDDDLGAYVTRCASVAASQFYFVYTLYWASTHPYPFTRADIVFLVTHLSGFVAYLGSRRATDRGSRWHTLDCALPLLGAAAGILGIVFVFFRANKRRTLALNH